MAEGSLSIADILVLAAAFLLALIGALEAPRFWRGELKQIHASGFGAWWPFGRTLLQGVLRSLHFSFLAALGAVMSFAFLVARDLQLMTSQVAKRLGRASFFLFLISCLLILVTVLINRPRSLVPPAHRDEPGAVMYWWSMLRRRGSGDRS